MAGRETRWFSLADHTSIVASFRPADILLELCDVGAELLRDKALGFPRNAPAFGEEVGVW